MLHYKGIGMPKSTEKKAVVQLSDRARHGRNLLNSSEFCSDPPAPSEPPAPPSPDSKHGRSVANGLLNRLRPQWQVA